MFQILLKIKNKYYIVIILTPKFILTHFCVVVNRFEQKYARFLMDFLLIICLLFNYIQKFERFIVQILIYRSVSLLQRRRGTAEAVDEENTDCTNNRLSPLNIVS